MLMSLRRLRAHAVPVVSRAEYEDKKQAGRAGTVGTAHPDRVTAWRALDSDWAGLHWENAFDPGVGLLSYPINVTDEPDRTTTCHDT